MLLSVVLLGGCGRPEAAPATPVVVAAASARAAAVTSAPPPSVAAAPPPASSALPGDEQLPEAWRARFRSWLAAQPSPIYVRVSEHYEMSNAVSIVLERRTTKDGVCLTGPSKLDFILEDGATQPKAEIQDFGNDCCAGTECVRTAEGWNLRYLAAVAANDWSELAKLVPAKGKLVSSVNGGEVPTVRVTRKDVAAGKFREAPGCGLIFNVPSCDELADSGFDCRCDGGGYHIVYSWEREGDGFVLVSTDESSH